jgi:biotin carboxyl carrier protein
MEETVKLKALTGDLEQTITITELASSVKIEIEGREYDLKVLNPDETSYVLVNNHRVYSCHVDRSSVTPNRFEVAIKGQRHFVTVVDPKRLRTDENSDRHDHGATEISAQMPGKVVRVLVEVGAKVEKGTGIVVVEAMKMQNEMKSPRAGVVVSVNVATGDTVNAGEVLATIGESEI